MKKCIPVIFLLLFFGCTSETTMTDYLTKVSANLEQVKSISYFSTVTSSAPGDTMQFSDSRKYYRKILVNPGDSLVGSSSALFNSDDTTKMITFYDGIVQGKINWDKQRVSIDSFKNNHAPFRLVYYALYTKVKEIIKYTLTTKDSIQTDFKDYGDSVFFSLRIINKHVYFHIKPIVVRNEYIPEDEVSQFDIWFNKKDDMPYRMRSKWSHTTYFEYCEDARFNVNKSTDFDFDKFYPEYFKVTQFIRGQPKKKIDLTGKKAPAWILKDTDQNDQKISDLKSKVVLIQFTGVGCGPCHHSLPFLKSLVKEYKTADLEVVSIETWSKNIEGLRRYQQKNELPWKFLISNDEVVKEYGVQSVPLFFILDENRIIRKVISGYVEKVTDLEIIAAIKEIK